MRQHITNIYLKIHTGEKSNNVCDNDITDICKHTLEKFVSAYNSRDKTLLMSLMDSNKIMYAGKHHLYGLLNKN